MNYNIEEKQHTNNKILNNINDIIEPVVDSTQNHEKKIYHNRNINNNHTKKTISLNNLESMLENERNNNDNETWTKLSKTIKLKKLLVYVSKYSSENNLSAEEENKLIIFFKDCLDKKKLQRVKDVEYDRNNGNIISIPALIHNKNNHNFTLKNVYKKVVTVKCLTSQKKNKIINDKLFDENENIDIDIDDETNNIK